MIEKRYFPNGRAVFIYNSAFFGEPFSSMRALFREAFHHNKMALDFKESAYYASNAIEDLSTIPYTHFIFYDKDVSLASRLERAGKKVHNPSSSISICDSKIETGLRLAENKIATIPFFISPFQFEGSLYNPLEVLSRPIKEYGFPLIIKEEYGSLGEQVYKALDMEDAFSIINKIKPPKRFLVEPYFENNGEDHRLYIVGEKVIGAIKRKNDADFRSNVEHGGKGYPYEPSLEEKELALKAHKALGLEFSGVDILFDNNGNPLICEVNSCPHFMGLLKATGIDMAEEIAEYLLCKNQATH